MSDMVYGRWCILLTLVMLISLYVKFKEEKNWKERYGIFDEFMEIKKNY